MNKERRQKEGASSTNEKLQCFLKTIKIILLIQITFGFFIPCVDTFLDLGDGFHSCVHRLYARKFNTEDTICVPGSGFSGFWFTLGRLHALEHDRQLQLQNLDGTTAGSVEAHRSAGELFSTSHRNRTMQYMDKPRNLQYECYSSGCLAVVATLLNHKIESVLDLAVDAQSLWRQGKIRRYEVVDHFVDGLLHISREVVLNHDDEYETFENASSVLENLALSRIHIITTGLNWDDPHYGFLKYHSRSPAHTQELKELLMQTTWIPYATGKSLWRRDEIKGDYHMDGAFSVLSHPKCRASVDLPLRADLLLNGLSPDLERSKARHFYNLGLNEIM